MAVISCRCDHTRHSSGQKHNIVGANSQGKQTDNIHLTGSLIGTSSPHVTLPLFDAFRPFGDCFTGVNGVSVIVHTHSCYFYPHLLP